MFFRVCACTVRLGFAGQNRRAKFAVPPSPAVQKTPLRGVTMASQCIGAHRKNRVLQENAARRAAGAQTPPLLQSDTEARAQHETGSGSCGHFAAPKLPRNRHRTDKPTLPRAPGALRRQMSQFWASSAHARVPNNPKTRRGRKNDCFCRECTVYAPRSTTEHRSMGWHHPGCRAGPPLPP